MRELLEAHFPKLLEISGEIGPSGAFEVVLPDSGKVLHSKIHGDGFADSEDKVKKIFSAIREFLKPVTGLVTRGTKKAKEAQPTDTPELSHKPSVEPVKLNRPSVADLFQQASSESLQEIKPSVSPELRRKASSGPPKESKSKVIAERRLKPSVEPEKEGQLITTADLVDEVEPDKQLSPTEIKELIRETFTRSLMGIKPTVPSELRQQSRVESPKDVKPTTTSESLREPYPEYPLKEVKSVISPERHQLSAGPVKERRYTAFQDLILQANSVPQKEGRLPVPPELRQQSSVGPPKEGKLTASPESRRKPSSGPQKPSFVDLKRQPNLGSQKEIKSKYLLDIKHQPSSATQKEGKPTTSMEITGRRQPSFGGQKEVKPTATPETRPKPETSKSPAAKTTTGAKAQRKI